MLCAQRLSGRSKHGVLPVFAGSRAEECLDEVASRNLVFVERTAGYVGLEVMLQLGGDEVPQHVIVVVDEIEPVFS